MKSTFRFEITQTRAVMLYKIIQGDGKRWTIEGDPSGTAFSLHDLKKPENFITVKSMPGKIIFETTNGFVYEITDKKGDGANVCFHGPVNALLTQGLLPRMSYVPETLIGKTDEMDEFVDIQEFMKLREERHQRLGTENPQDKHGWRVNANLNNELYPWLPPSNNLRTKQPKKKGKNKRK